jgi:hypothetical protein
MDTSQMTVDPSHFVVVMPGVSSEVNVAKTGLWAEIQRERARQQRLRDQEFRAFRQAEESAQRERVRAEKAAAGRPLLTSRKPSDSTSRIARPKRRR